MGIYDKQVNAEIDTGPREPAAKQAKRIPVDYLYSKLNWDFIKLMAQIAQYAEGKYGAAEQYTESRLTGEKEPINHVFEHARQYLVGEDHDHFKTKEHQLAAIAYNAMMQYFYHVCGAESPAGLYGARELPRISADNFTQIEHIRTEANGSGPLEPTPLSTAIKDPLRGVKRAVEAIEGSKELHVARKSGFYGEPLEGLTARAKYFKGV